MQLMSACVGLVSTITNHPNLAPIRSVVDVISDLGVSGVRIVFTKDAAGSTVDAKRDLALSLSSPLSQFSLSRHANVMTGFIRLLQKHVKSFVRLILYPSTLVH